MFAMDCAAITKVDVSNPTENGVKKQTILVPDILSRHSVTTQESSCSWIALEEPGHFLRQKRWGDGVINLGHDLEDVRSIAYDYNKRVST